MRLFNSRQICDNTRVHCPAASCWPTSFSQTSFILFLHPINFTLFPNLWIYPSWTPRTPQLIVPMSDITHLSLNSFFIFKSSTLSYIVRFLLNRKIVNTIIFWFNLTRFMNSLLSVGNFTSLPIFPLSASPLLPFVPFPPHRKNLHSDLRVVPLISNPPHHSTPSNVNFRHVMKLSACNVRGHDRCHDCPEQ